VSRSMSSVRTGYGRDAYDALRAAVADRKRADPLAPVTVLVPNQVAGACARRALAHGVGDRDGIAGLTVLTVDRLAERLAASAMIGSGRRPITPPVLAAAWRRALARAPGALAPLAVAPYAVAPGALAPDAFAKVVEHGRTFRALAEAHRELRDVDAAGLQAIAAHGGTIAADLVRLHRGVVTALTPAWYDEADLRRAAADALADRPGLAAEIGAVILFLPQDLPTGVQTLLAHFGTVHTITGSTGESRADGPTDTPPDSVSARTANPSHVLHCSDADDEVRRTVRRLAATVQHTAAGRVAVLYCDSGPYARLLAEHLDATGVRWNGTGARPAVECGPARVLRDVLEVHAGGWRRAAVMRLLAGLPAGRADGRRLPIARWERISRSAAVSAGDDWEVRLTAYAAQKREASDRDGHESGSVRHTGHGSGRERGSDQVSAGAAGADGRRDDADAADQLRIHVAGLRALLHDGERLGTWPALADWARRAFAALVGDLDVASRPPERACVIHPPHQTCGHEHEPSAAAAAPPTLDGLSGLDAIEPYADLTLLALTLEAGLAAEPPRRGTAGDGVLVAPLSAAIGLDADAVFVLGLSEDLRPGSPRADPLLPDEVRALAGGQLPTVHDRTARAHRHVLAAFAAAPDVTASCTRNDLRRSATHLPSRWPPTAGSDVEKWSFATGVGAAAPSRPDDPGLAKESQDLELPPWRKGRYGTAIGRAVHGVLQTVELATGLGFSDAVAAQTLVEGVVPATELVAALASSALAAPVVRRAAARPHWRESYVATVVGDRVLDGVVDLLYRDDDGLVLVDCKTDAGPATTLPARVECYRPQLAAYAAAVQAATGEPVVRCVLLFLSPDGADALVVPGIPAAVAEIRQAVLTA
jgi:ATP-dependent helicase/nuclease subunit B